MTNQQKSITQQWVKREVFNAMERCAKYRPDFQVHVTELESDEGMVKAKIHFNSVGKTLFTQKLTHFIITAMLEFKDESVEQN